MAQPASTVRPPRSLDPAALLAELDAEQRHAVTVDAAPLAILAGAGAGKTRVLTRRIAHRVATGSAHPEHVVVVTFTRRAAQELRVRLQAVGLHRSVTAGTFHALAWGLLRQWWSDQRRPPAELLPRPLTVLGPLVRAGRRAGDPEVNAMALSAEIAWAKARLVTPDGYEAAARHAGRRPALPVASVATLYGRYEEAKRTRRLVDFDDVLWRCLGVMERDDAFAAAVRWRWRHLFADEFQDVNPLQFRLLESWRGGRPDLCVVGDPQQAIYGWNGADPALLVDLATHLPGTTVVRLGANHRTTPEIVSVAEAMLPSGGVRGAAAQVATSGSGPVPRVHEARDAEHEGSIVAAVLDAARAPGTSWRSMAVLARTHAQLAVVRGALAAARIPHRVRSASSLLEDVDVLEWLSQAEGGTLADALATLREAAQAHAPAPDAPLAVVADLAADLLAVDPSATVAAFGAWLAATGDDHAHRGPDAVELVTFHAAKGLEWPVVAVVGFEDGFVPSAGASRGAARFEEARLAYVALTRARRELHITWARTRVINGARSVRAPSPWLEAIQRAVDELEGRDDRDAVRALLATRGRSPRPHDPLLDDLLAWRATRARAAAVAPAAVCDDDVLSAVARHRPTTMEELDAVAALGPLVLQRIGVELLDVVRAWGQTAATGRPLSRL